LTGVDLTSWGADLPSNPKLGNLVLRILRLIPDLQRLRLSSIDSIEVDPFLLEAIANERRLMPHLHLSLQSGDNMILKRMKRRHSRDDAIKFCNAARKLRPEITFGADIIAGFPTETEEMFENSLKLIDECGLTWLHVFPFSARTGTPAARMPQTDGKITKKRATALRNLGKIQVAKHLKSEIGKRHNILIETPRTGRTEQFTEVLFDTNQIPGDIVKKKILGSVDSKLYV
jgi:threonylcarbamoyladenosine tRNA methylthiotransferase MtaB